MSKEKIVPNILDNDVESIFHYLHHYPELSGKEEKTAQYITEQLQLLKPDIIRTHIAEHGIAATFDSHKAGAHILFRTELDALPIQELTDDAYCSRTPHVSHQCGHDGHMSILLALGKKIAENRPHCGKVTLLFQPAEETGEGARAVVADKAFSELSPDYCFALHNLPSYPVGEVIVKSGNFSCASRGMMIHLLGKTAHAAYPETGISPQFAIAELLQQLPYLPAKLTSEPIAQGDSFRNELKMLTLVHCCMGEAAFGTSPADGRVYATLRTETNESMAQLVTSCSQLAEELAQKYQLQLTIEWTDIFAASVNDTHCVDAILKAAKENNRSVRLMKTPFRWSEDFGAIIHAAQGAMFALGAGEDNPQIHNPDYRFPKELIGIGSGLFYSIYQDYLGE